MSFLSFYYTKTTSQNLLIKPSYIEVPLLFRGNSSYSRSPAEFLIVGFRESAWHRRWMAHLYEEYDNRRRNPDPHKAAFLVIDMQVYFKETATPILLTIRRTIDSCRAENIPVVYTRHSHKNPSDYGMQEEWWNLVIHDGTSEAELMQEVDRRATDKIVHKHTYSGFYGTDLEKYWREQGKSEVIITGVMTNLCTETTARGQRMRLLLKISPDSGGFVSVNECFCLIRLKSTPSIKYK